MQELDADFLLGGKLNFGELGGIEDALFGDGMVGQIDARARPEAVDNPVRDDLIEVLFLFVLAK